jgi:hypothetical protein
VESGNESGKVCEPVGKIFGGEMHGISLNGKLGLRQV